MSCGQRWPRVVVVWKTRTHPKRENFPLLLFTTSSYLRGHFFRRRNLAGYWSKIRAKRDCELQVRSGIWGVYVGAWRRRVHLATVVFETLDRYIRHTPWPPLSTWASVQVSQVQQRPEGPARGKFELLSLRKCRQRRTPSSSEFQARSNRGLTSGLQPVDERITPPRRSRFLV